MTTPPHLTSPAHMRAAVHARYGPPSVVAISDVPRPEPGATEVRIKMHAATVNRTDCAYRWGKPFLARAAYGPIRPRATILGNEFAGRIDAVGSRVSRFAVGDRVFGYCEGRFGAHAEYLVISETASLAPMPDNWTYSQLAPATEGAHYALSMITAAKILSGQRVLVYGATGGIGSAAVQLLRVLGAEVSAVCQIDNVQTVHDLGADRVIQTQDFADDDHTYDVIIDAVGKTSFGACRRLLTPRGIYLSSELGPHSQNPFLALATPLLRGRRVMFPIPTHNQEMVQYFRRLINAGQFAPLIDRTYPLERIVEAYQYVETGQKIGNVVLTIDGSN